MVATDIYIPLVNDLDEIIGEGEKLAVHQSGQLHRAFSILVHNGQGEWLIHQRAFHKYHSGGLWTNTCCGHPNVGEDMEAAIHRRLQEEMGFDCPLEFQFKFRYQAELDHNLIEHEIDHVFIGRYDDSFVVNPEEVADFRWMTFEDIQREIQTYPERFTVWFKEIMKQLTLQKN
ncbi:MAG: isopentenyl-diphosphate Delta-isomerase [Spirosomataceae bacterium]